MHYSHAILLLMCGITAFAKDYTTYIGDAYPYQVSAIATDASGNTYVTGSRAVVILPGPSYFGLGFPASQDPLGRNAFELVPSGKGDVFVGKVDPFGNLTLLATLSGKGSELANGIALDPSGNIYIVGSTTSSNFPLQRPLQSTPGTRVTGFVVKLNPQGGILFATYFGGTTGDSVLTGVAVDSKGDVYVTGATTAPDYPHTSGLPAASVYAFSIGRTSGALFAKIASAGDKILYAGSLAGPLYACGTGSTCFVSPTYSSGTAIAVDPAGNAYVAGNTGGAGLPTTAGVLRAEGIGAFVAKVNAAGTGLVYATLLGSTNYIPPPVSPGSNPGNFVFAIAADRDGNAYIAGSTSDPAFPATGLAFQTTLSLPHPQNSNPFLAPPSDAFIAKLNPTGTAMVWATFLGGTANDRAQSVALDPAGNVWVSGATASTDFPASSRWPNGSEFLVELNSSGSALSYSAVLPGNLIASEIALDSGGTVHQGGASGLISAFTPESAPWQTSGSHLFGIGNSAGGEMSGRLAPGELISIYGLHLGPSTPVSANNAAGFLPTTLAGVQVMINGISAPLQYVSEAQINAVAPMKLAPGPATLRLVANDGSIRDFRVVVDTAAPQVFRNSDLTAAINQDGTLNSKTNPAKVGSYVAIWATGTGAPSFSVADGQIATSAQPLCLCQIRSSPLEVFSSLPVAYAGAAPGLVNGVVQVNFRVPSLSSGNFEIAFLVVNEIYSDPFYVFVTP